jgi:hypothetical protein
MGQLPKRKFRNLLETKGVVFGGAFTLIFGGNLSVHE